MKDQIPNSITILSLILSCLAIISVFEGKLDVASYLLIGSCACDFFDGFSARLLKVDNPIGKEIDSLVDMVAFGVAPSILLFRHIQLAQASRPVALLTDYPMLIYLVLLIPIFSACRLAKFNIDTRQTKSFIGLAVPAHASFYIFCTLLFLYPDLPKVIDVGHLVTPVVSNPLVMLGFAVFFSFMLVAEVPMFSLKFTSLNWKENALPFTFILIWLLMLVFMNIVAMPTIVILYVLWSIILNTKKKPQQELT